MFLLAKKNVYCNCCVMQHLVVLHIWSFKNLWITLTYKLCINDSLAIKQSACIWSSTCLFPLFWTWRVRNWPLYGLTLSFQVILKGPRLVTSNDTLQKMEIIWILKMQATFFPDVLLIMRHAFRNNFCTDLSTVHWSKFNKRCWESNSTFSLLFWPAIDDLNAQYANHEIIWTKICICKPANGLQKLLLYCVQQIWSKT